MKKRLAGAGNSSIGGPLIGGFWLENLKKSVSSSIWKFSDFIDFPWESFRNSWQCLSDTASDSNYQWHLPSCEGGSARGWLLMITTDKLLLFVCRKARDNGDYQRKEKIRWRDLARVNFEFRIGWKLENIWQTGFWKWRTCFVALRLSWSTLDSHNKLKQIAEKVVRNCLIFLSVISNLIIISQENWNTKNDVFHHVFLKEYCDHFQTQQNRYKPCTYSSEQRLKGILELIWSPLPSFLVVWSSTKLVFLLALSWNVYESAGRSHKIHRWAHPAESDVITVFRLLRAPIPGQSVSLRNKKKGGSMPPGGMRKHTNVEKRKKKRIESNAFFFQFLCSHHWPRPFFQFSPFYVRFVHAFQPAQYVILLCFVRFSAHFSGSFRSFPTPPLQFPVLFSLSFRRFLTNPGSVRNSD